MQSISVMKYSDGSICERNFFHRGLPSQAFEYIKYRGGLMTEDGYPYKGHVSMSVGYHDRPTAVFQTTEENCFSICVDSHRFQLKARQRV